MTLRVLIADDELLARRRLHRLLGALPDVEVVGECGDGKEVLARVHQGGVDVVLLDIHMPHLSGMEAMRLFPADGPYVIFCTAHPDHAVQAFDSGAVDYVLKPLEPARLQKALERARSRDAQRRFEAERARHRPGAAATAPPALERLPIPTRQGIVLVDPRQVTHLQLGDGLVTVFTLTGQYLSDASLQELQARLPPTFERVHRRALLNLEQVRQLEPLETGGYIARTVQGHAVEVSRQSARELRRRLGLRRGPDDEP
ncbi:response regulator transcription factor [Aggregicoccus sp. 17bor-14]|uniref:LytR/AlgR family response regulator transcription factor n=1 Tax=Myxococcaceae TaxID=31 RepID=UPI00129C153A|nr:MULTISPECIES: LytTR family DNA-binding domain-containing protein [Myxococcaceae]MBF5041954.1 response regulator transcription factor [Simulacricoccus sp. 17bor-14]MRI87735.1 response regulator transcription factor [Aggregicoccus sp. 17bor-14]